MADITRESLEPILASHDVEGPVVSCVFRCPESGDEFPASHTVKQEKTIASAATSSAKQGLMRTVRSSIFGAARSLFGSGIVGRAAGEALRQADRQVSQSVQKVKLNEKQIEEGILECFKTVASCFVWDDKAERYVGAKLAKDTMTAFTLQLTDAPVTVAYDRSVLDRMMVEIAAADGDLDDDEAAMITDFLSEESGGVEALRGKSALTATELGECAEGESRRTMLMLCWAIALTDEELGDDEAERLAAFAAGLGIAEAAAEEIKLMAQCFIIDQTVAACHDNDGDVEEAFALAEKIGLAREEAERVEIRYRKRNHIF